MSTLIELQKQLAEERKKGEQLANDVYSYATQIRLQTAQLRILRERRKGLPFADDENLKKNENAHALKSRAWQEQKAKIIDKAKEFIEAGRNGEHFSLLEADVPILLLPVRIETRFCNDGKELRIRIFPDDAAISTHENELTQDEIDSGQTYWRKAWQAKRDSKPNDEKDAWRELHAKYGTTRAAWIRIKTTPVNLADGNSDANPSFPQLIAEEIESGKVYWGYDWRGRRENNDQLLKRAQVVLQNMQNKYGKKRAGWICTKVRPTNYNNLFREAEPVFPTNVNEIRSGSWTKAPVSFVMPDFWMVLTPEGNGFRKLATGRPIPANLPVGPAYAETVNNSKIDADKNIAWLWDFEEAEKVGMGMRFNLEPKDIANNGFERLLVIGLRASDDADASATILEKLLNNHHYAEGLSLIEQGTPTNNTTDLPSGYSSKGLTAEDSYGIECCGPLYTDDNEPTKQCDGQRLASAFGLSSAVFQNIKNANEKEEQEARAMAAALWPATMGFFLEQILIDPSAKDAFDKIRSHFSQYVRGRGPFAAIRAGNMPYGILPVSSLRNWQARPSLREAPAGDSYETKFRNVLGNLYAKWLGMSKSVPCYVGDDPEKELIEILGMEPASINYQARYFVALEWLTTLWGYAGVTLPNKNKFLEQYKKLLVDIATALGCEDVDLRLLFVPLGTIGDDKLQLEQLTLPLVQSDPLAENAPRLADPLKKIDYIQTLLDKIRFYQNNPDAKIQDVFLKDEISTPRPLLYLLLRHSILADYCRVARQIIDDPGNMREKDFYMNTDELPWKKYFDEKIDIGKLKKPWQDEIARRITDKTITDVLGPGGLITSERIARITTMLNRYRYNLSPQRCKEIFGEAQNIYSTKGSQDDKKRNMQAMLSTELQTGKVTVGECINVAMALADPLISDLKLLEQSLEELKGIPTARLERLLTETLDLCSHRLDAWITSIVTERLTLTRRRSKQKGIYMGAYGWLEKVQPSKGKEFVRVPELDLLAEKPKDRENGGFIHAPSLNHATAAAVLRNAYISHAVSTDNNPLAVNLSSKRVRKSLWILEGIRQGQSLGMLLGYEFERGLHEKSMKYSVYLDQYIDNFRKVYPLKATPPSKGGESEPDDIQYIQARSVVDGLALWESYVNHKNKNTVPSFFSQIFSQDEWNAITAKNWGKYMISLLEDLDNIVDSLGDLGLAESVYQSIQGKYLRAGAILDAISSGSRPPEPEIAMTPRSGFRFTHRFVVVLPNDENVPAGWILTPRAQVNRKLNGWVGRLLGPAENIKCTVTKKSATENNEDIEEITVTAKDLKLAPLDFLCLASSAAKGEATELERGIEYFVRMQKDPIDLQSQIKIIFNRQDNWNKNDKTFPEMIQLARVLNDMITSARPLDIRDFVLPEEIRTDKNTNADLNLGLTQWQIEVGLTDAEFELARQDIENVYTGQNIENVYNSFKAVCDCVDACYTEEYENFKQKEIRECLKVLSDAGKFNVSGAIPYLPDKQGAEPIDEEEFRVHLWKQGKSVRAELNRRKQNIGRVKGELESSNLTPTKKLSLLLEFADILFAKSVKLISLFNLNSKVLNEVNSSLNGFKSLTDLTDDTLREWLRGAALVRPSLQRYQTEQLFLTAFGTQPEKKLRVAQLPFKINDRWIGLEFKKDDETPAQGKISIVGELPEKLASDNGISGFIVDEWVETIPSSKETTAVAFHCNQPSQEAPQALLLAVSPNSDGKWKWEDLAAAVNETLDLAKTRAVDLNALEELGHFLPALYFARNLVERHTYQIDFRNGV